MKGLKNISITDTRTQMTFCASCRTCPAIDISKDSDKVIVGGKDEGYTHFTKEQFALFVKTVKKGMYDKYLPKDCICGQTSNEDGTCDGSHTNVCADEPSNECEEDEPLDQNEIGFGD